MRAEKPNVNQFVVQLANHDSEFQICDIGQQDVVIRTSCPILVLVSHSKDYNIYSELCFFEAGLQLSLSIYVQRLK